MVFLDMVGVGLFVPLLSYYWKDLGVRPELLGNSFKFILALPYHSLEYVGFVPPKS